MQKLKTVEVTRFATHWKHFVDCFSWNISLYINAIIDFHLKESSVCLDLPNYFALVMRTSNNLFFKLWERNSYSNYLTKNIESFIVLHSRSVMVINYSLHRSKTQSTMNTYTISKLRKWIDWSKCKHFLYQQ